MSGVTGLGRRLDARRALQLMLAAAWLLCGVLEYQRLVFATLPLLLGLGIAFRPTLRLALAASAVWGLWLVLWLSMTWFALWPAIRAPRTLHGIIAGAAAGEPNWLAAVQLLPLLILLVLAYWPRPRAVTPPAPTRSAARSAATTPLTEATASPQQLAERPIPIVPRIPAQRRISVEP